MHIGGARDPGDPVPNLLCQLVVVRRVPACNLHVNRRGQAETQNLVGDIRRLEEEHHVGELLGEPSAKLRSVLAHGPMLLASQRNQDLSVGGRNVRDIALRQTAPGVRDADVAENRVDLSGRKGIADLLLHIGEAQLGLFNSCAGRRTRVKP